MIFVEMVFEVLWAAIEGALSPHARAVPAYAGARKVSHQVAGGAPSSM